MILHNFGTILIYGSTLQLLENLNLLSLTNLRLIGIVGPLVLSQNVGGSTDLLGVQTTRLSQRGIGSAGPQNTKIQMELYVKKILT